MFCRDCSNEITTTCKSHLKQRRCRVCCYAYYKVRFYKDPEHARVLSKRRNDNYYAKPECRERKLKYVKQWMRDNSERRNAYCRNWRLSKKSPTSP